MKREMWVQVDLPGPWVLLKKEPQEFEVFWTEEVGLGDTNYR